MSVNLPTRPFQRVAITFFLAVGSFLVTLDTTIANVVLPEMQGGLGTTQDQISWIITSYIVTSAIFTPLAGNITAPLGRKPVLIFSLGGFIVASMMCGFATDLNQMVLFRALQGATSAALMPLAQSYLFDMYTREEHPKAMSIFSLGVIMGPILGPTLGGYLSEWGNWRWVFFINLPVAGAALVGLAFFLPRSRRKVEANFDYAGFALLAIALACFQLMLDRGEGEGWFDSQEIVLWGVFAAAALYFFVSHMLTTKHPFLDLDLFRDANFLAGLAVSLAVGMSIFTTIVIIPPFLQTLQGYSVIETGLIMTPRGFGTAFAFVIGPMLVRLYDPRLVLTSGVLCAIVGLYGMTGWTLEVGPWPIIWTGIVHGMGLGLIFMPLSIMTFATLRHELRDQGTALYTLTRNTGGAVGIAVGVAILTSSTDTNLAELLTYFTPYGASPLSAGEIPWPTDDPQGLLLLKSEVIRQATMVAYQNTFLFMTFATMAVLPVILLLRTPPPQEAAA